MRIIDWSSGVCSSFLLDVAAFGEAVFVVWVVVVGQMADHAHLQADPVLEEFQRDRCMDRLVEDRLVLAVTERQAFDVAKPAIRRLIAAGRSEERRVGKACVSTCRYRWSTYHE